MYLKRLEKKEFKKGDKIKTDIRISTKQLIPNTTYIVEWIAPNGFIAVKSIDGRVRAFAETNFNIYIY